MMQTPPTVLFDDWPDKSNGSTGSCVSRGLITQAVRQNPLTDFLPAPGYWSGRAG
jgi:hypothetical protein